MEGSEFVLLTPRTLIGTQEARFIHAFDFDVLRTPFMGVPDVEMDHKGLALAAASDNGLHGVPSGMLSIWSNRLIRKADRLGCFIVSENIELDFKECGLSGLIVDDPNACMSTLAIQPVYNASPDESPQKWSPMAYLRVLAYDCALLGNVIFVSTPQIIHTWEQVCIPYIDHASSI